MSDKPSDNSRQEDQDRLLANEPRMTPAQEDEAWRDSEIGRDLGGYGQGCGQRAGVVLVTILLALAIWCWPASQSTTPGELITVWAGSTPKTAHASTAVDNPALPECFVTDATVPCPGLRIRFFPVGASIIQPVHGIWLKGGYILLNDGTVVSDACLPRKPPYVPDSSGTVDSSAQPPLPPIPDSTGALMAATGVTK